MSGGRKRCGSGCPIDYSLDIFGDRWTLLVIRDLLLVGKRHFKELMDSPERIASNILSARLKKLEERGVIARAPDPEKRKQVIYTVTAKGHDLLPILFEIARWGGKYDPNTPVPRYFVKRGARDNDALLKEIREAMTEAARSMTARKPRGNRRPAE